MTDNFEFILNRRFNSILNRDYKNADKAKKNKLFKSAVILYGGIIEGMLQYLLLTKVYNNPTLQKGLKEKGDKKIRSYYERIKKLRFEEVISLANEIKLINEAGGAFLVKNFRNFVHIFKELEDNIEINKEEAETAKKFTDSIILTLKDHWSDSVENGKLFFNNKRLQYQEARKKEINHTIIEELFANGFIDFSSHSGKFFGAHLGSMSKKGICQVDPLSWSVKTRCFQKRIFNPVFKEMAETYLKSKRINTK